jgi:hypothetical protein
MPKLKGSAMSALLAVAKKQSPEIYNLWINTMPVEERERYLHLFDFKWYPLPMDDNNGLVILGELVFPNDPLATRKIASLQFTEGLNSIYTLFLRIPSINFVIGKAVKIWQTYHDTGTFELNKIGEFTAVIILKHYENLPAYMQQVIWGSLEGITELLKKRAVVTFDNRHPSCWKWTVTY